MIDVENKIYDPIAKTVRASFPMADISGEYVRAPAKFPHVSVVESDNYMTIRHIDSSNEEKFATIMFEVNVYSNKVGGKKSEAREILNLIDQKFYSMNFTRIAMTPVPNLEDSTIYRITARYRAETDGVNLYRI